MEPNIQTRWRFSVMLYQIDDTRLFNLCSEVIQPYQMKSSQKDPFQMLLVLQFKVATLVSLRC